jgi:hypothetical protein
MEKTSWSSSFRRLLTAEGLVKPESSLFLMLFTCEQHGKQELDSRLRGNDEQKHICKVKHSCEGRFYKLAFTA